MKNLILILALRLSSLAFAQEFKTYTCISGDCNNGFGTKNYDIGNSYTGQFKNRSKDGEGTEIYNGTTYKGQFKNGFKDGEGTEIKKDGTTYKGQWKKGHREGEGTETNPDGITLTGNWNSHEDLEGNGIETLPNGYYMTAKYLYIGQKNTKCFDNNNVEISRTQYDELKENKYSAKKNDAKLLAAQPKCISGDCQNGYGVIRYSDGTKYFGMCKNGTYEGLGYVVAPDVTTYKYDDKDGRDPYGGLYSLKQVPVVTPGKVSFGEWKNGVNTRNFNNMDEFSGVVYRELNGEYSHFMDYFFNTSMANSEAERKRIDRENEAAYGRELMKKMENVSITPSSSSSNETTVKTTTITKSGNEIIDFKTVSKQ
ncbi:MAG TPA: hypothetical protein PLD18_12300 [Flavobacterium sp.]|nr:hypothetical protein [Flavobacterium sp.]HRA72302.1 hypothetical protein [Flavobacterium sp.]